MKLEDILYEAHTLGIREEVLVEVRIIRTKNPHTHLTIQNYLSTNTRKKMHI